MLKDLKTYQANAIVQDESQANYAEKISTEDGKINWQNEAFFIQRQIRALNAYTQLDDERIKVLQARPIKPDQATNEPAGKIISVGKKAILVACGKNEQGVQHLINIPAMQWAGGKPLTAEQIANGNKLHDGDMFQ